MNVVRLIKRAKGRFIDGWKTFMIREKALDIRMRFRPFGAKDFTDIIAPSRTLEVEPSTKMRE